MFVTITPFSCTIICACGIGSVVLKIGKNQNSMVTQSGVFYNLIDFENGILMLILEHIVINGNNLGLIMKKNSFFTKKEKHLWMKVYFKSILMVTKQKLQNVILSWNLNKKCKSWFFLKQYYDCLTITWPCDHSNRCQFS